MKNKEAPMSLFKKLLVILTALIAAGCESGAITQDKQAIARCDIYKTGPQYAEARRLSAMCRLFTPFQTLIDSEAVSPMGSS